MVERTVVVAVFTNSKMTESDMWPQSRNCPAPRSGTVSTNRIPRNCQPERWSGPLRLPLTVKPVASFRKHCDYIVSWRKPRQLTDS
jgi:hypothetical protein